MKIIFFFLLLLMPLKVNANSSYLTDFQVTNGVLLTEFNEQNNLYTIKLDEDAQMVQFTYTLKEETSHVEVIDNHFDDTKENIMIIKVTNEEGADNQTYTFYLEKEESMATTALEDSTNALQITKQERSPFLAPTVIIGCGLCIALLFYFLIFRFFKKTASNPKSPHNM